MVGTRPTKEHNWSRFLNRIISSISERSVMEVTRAIPGILCNSFNFGAYWLSQLIFRSSLFISNSCLRKYSDVSRVPAKTRFPYDVAISTDFSHWVNLPDQCLEAESKATGIVIPLKYSNDLIRFLVLPISLNRVTQAGYPALVP
jgi:hypothetical protein